VVPWVLFYVAIAVAGLAVLALMTLRLYQQVRQFARDVGAAGERISKASVGLDQVDPPTNRSSRGSSVVN
jgi:hypothetical protein